MKKILFGLILIAPSLIIALVLNSLISFDHQEVNIGRFEDGSPYYYVIDELGEKCMFTDLENPVSYKDGVSMCG